MREKGFRQKKDEAAEEEDFGEGKRDIWSSLGKEKISRENFKEMLIYDV